MRWLGRRSRLRPSRGRGSERHMGARNWPAAECADVSPFVSPCPGFWLCRAKAHWNHNPRVGGSSPSSGMRSACTSACFGASEDGRDTRKHFACPPRIWSWRVSFYGPVDKCVPWRVPTEQDAQPVAHHRVVVGDDDAHDVLPRSSRWWRSTVLTGSLRVHRRGGWRWPGRGGRRARRPCRPPSPRRRAPALGGRAPSRAG